MDVVCRVREELESESVPSPKEQAEGPSLGSQIQGLLILLPVLGVLWLLSQYLPLFGGWMSSRAGEFTRATDEGDPVEIKEQQVSNVPDREAATSVEPVRSTDGWANQIVAQLGGSDRVEVRHLAVSDDEARMVAALKILDQDGKRRLIEVLFERDEFGRYVSTEDSFPDQSIKLWEK